ncbi:acyl carrier protein [Roseomonas sp. 18066]|uniref:acyl carrier protein n=1 Tax=Roseomonas sp. 18066 TaxID=2681412 RepID=UPI001358D358|nr:acyl carrier protein [Roseomonas sp. 18066]
MTGIETAVRDALASRARLSSDAKAIGAEDDLFDRGLTSLMTVDVMLALEERFDLEFPEEALTRNSFRSVASLRDLLVSLGANA